MGITYFKANTEHDDDAALAGLVAILKGAAKEVTGGESTEAESQRAVDSGR